MFGRQPHDQKIGETEVWVMPSSSARCAQLPRAVDKVPFFGALKKFLDYIKGVITELDDAEVVFANVVLKNYPRKVKLEIKADPDAPATADEQTNKEGEK